MNSVERFKNGMLAELVVKAMQSHWVRIYLQPFTQDGSCEVVCHELMVDEAHDTVRKEDSRKPLAQQHFLH